MPRNTWTSCLRLVPVLMYQNTPVLGFRLLFHIAINHTEQINITKTTFPPIVLFTIFYTTLHGYILLGVIEG